MNWKEVLWLILYPIKDLGYFKIYYNIVQQIVQHGNVKFLLIFHLFSTLLALKAAHFVYLAFAFGGSAAQIVIHFDVFYYIVPRALLNIIASAVATMVLYYSHKLIGTRNWRLIESLNSVIALDDASFFVESSLNNRNVCAQTRKCYLITLNLLMAVMFNFDMIILGSYVYFAYEYYHHCEHFLGKSLYYIVSSLVVSHLSHAGFALYMSSAGHSIALNFANTMGLLMMFYIKVRQTFAKLTKLAANKKQFNLLGYVWFRKQFLGTLVFFFRTNRTYGRTFCALLVVFCPTNIMFTMWIIQGELGPIRELNLYSWIAYVACTLFVLHLIFAYCSIHIHKPSKVYLHWIVGLTRPSISTRTRAKLALDIFALHTPNRYGFTYGDFGLVSLATFTKFLMLYWKFCMISYKLMKKRII